MAKRTKCYKGANNRQEIQAQSERRSTKVLGYGRADGDLSAGKPSRDQRDNGDRNERSDHSRQHFPPKAASLQMKDQWRTDQEYNSGNHHSSRGSRYRENSPSSYPRAKPHSAERGRFKANRFPSRSHHGRGFGAGRGRGATRPSLSPGPPPRYPQADRDRFENDWGYPIRESSLPRQPKRRRTRSPSPESWSRRESPIRTTLSGSESRERYATGESRPVSSRDFSPRRQSPARFSRPASRDEISEFDTYIPSRRHRDRSPPPPARMRQGRSSSPYQRNPAVSPRRFDPSSPPQRGRPKREPFTYSQEDSPEPGHTFHSRRPFKRGSSNRQEQPYSRTPSVAGDWDQESMDAPYPPRGNYGNPNHMTRGRGQRPYNHHRGQHHGSPPYSASNSSYQGSPHSSSSYHGGRGGWDGPSHHGPPQGSNGPPIRQNTYPGAGQSQEEYFQSQMQPQGHHSHPNPSQRPFRGGRGSHRGSYQQQGPDRRFSGPDHPDRGPPPHRGRGSHYNNLQWTASNSKRGGGPKHPATGPNSVQASPSLSHKGSRASLDEYAEPESFRPPREPYLEDERDFPPDFGNEPPSNRQSKDTSKISFAFKSKQPPQAPARAPPDLNAKAKGPPHPPEHRHPPTQPKGKSFEKKHQKQFDRNERRNFDGPGRPQHTFQHRPPRSPAEPRDRSRSPPPKRLKQEPKPRPRLSPEMAASDSIYHRKPGNESVIGAGTYGKVFKAIHIYTKDKVALKKIRMEGERDGFPITAVREIKLLQNLRHKHVVALQEVMVEKNECFMVFEYMSHDLTGLINHPTFKLTPAHKKDLGRQMFEGLEFLHRRGVMHRDIKAANLLISHDGQLKYADFGLARFYTKSRQLDYTNRVITIWYRPPELLLGETQYGPSVDIWSAACVFMEMFTKKAIFPGEGGELSQLEKVYSVLGTPNRNDWPGIADLPWYELMQIPDRHKRQFEANFETILSPAALDLVKAIFSYDPRQRPNAEEALQHPYFTEEEPAPQQAYELADVGGDWHEYESKAHRRENERKEKERKKEEYIREKEKRKAKEAGLDSGSTGSESKKLRPESSDLEPGQGEPPPPPQDERAEESDGDGSARMSMS